MSENSKSTKELILEGMQKRKQEALKHVLEEISPKENIGIPTNYFAGQIYFWQENNTYHAETKLDENFNVVKNEDSCNKCLTFSHIMNGLNSAELLEFHIPNFMEIIFY